MRALSAVYRKEIRGYFDSPVAYVFIFMFLVIANLLFFNDFFDNNQADMRLFFGRLPFLFLVMIFLPAIAMRTWAEEKRSGTIEMLLSLPVPDEIVVLGKYLASLTFYAITLGLTISIPITIAFLGEPDIGIFVAQYVGALFMGAAFLSIGTLVSSMTRNQIISFVVAVVISLIFFFIGWGAIVRNAPDWLRPLLNYIGMGTHFESISKGVLDFRDLIYYLSVVGFCLFLNAKMVESRKWR